MDQTSTSDERHMRVALEAARACTEYGDVPVGCVIVRDADAQVVATAGNGRERFQDPTAAAEIIALRDAATAAGSWHLEDDAWWSPWNRARCVPAPSCSPASAAWCSGPPTPRRGSPVRWATWWTIRG